jgi:hypothetical protein
MATPRKLNPQKGGRKSKYRPEFLERAKALAAAGATDWQISRDLGTNRTTLWNWGAAHPEFLDAIRQSKTLSDERMERSLYERGIGYSFDAVKVFMPAGSKEPVYAPYTEHVPPDPASMIFWLKNRRPDRWRERNEAAFLLPPELAGVVQRVIEGVRGRLSAESSARPLIDVSPDRPEEAAPLPTEPVISLQVERAEQAIDSVVATDTPTEPLVDAPGGTSSDVQ